MAIGLDDILLPAIYLRAWDAAKSGNTSWICRWFRCLQVSSRYRKYATP